MSHKKVRAIDHFPLKKLSAHLTWGLSASILLLALFAKLAKDLLEQELGTFDQVIGEFIHSFTSDTLTSVALLFTTLGSAPVEISVMLIVGFYLSIRLKLSWQAVMLATSLAGGWLLNMVLKEFFHRSRPDIVHLVNVGGYSFPSGHAMVAASFYGMAGYLIWLSFKNRSKSSWYVIVLTATLIISIGLSRIYLGVHFPSDVLAGFAAGGVWLIACIKGFKTIGITKKHTKLYNRVKSS